MTEELIELTCKYNSRGMDGLNRFEKEKLFNYKKTEFLFEKFLAKRKNEASLQVTHENILNLGEESLRKLDAIKNRNTSIDFELNLRKEIEKLQKEVEDHKVNIKNEYHRKYESEKKSLKNSYESLMKRIEWQRDEAEEERVKEIVRKMNEECEIALKKQWNEAEELRKRTIEELREKIRKEAEEEMEKRLQKAIKDALLKAEEEFKLREKEAIRLTREQCELEYKRQLKQVCQKYEAQIEKLELRINELEQELVQEKTRRQKLQSDFRLLQVDYKRFMNYTNHYNSDYMMKLRHIGSELIEDFEFESKLDKKLHSSVSTSSSSKMVHTK